MAVGGVGGGVADEVLDRIRAAFASPGHEPVERQAPHGVSAVLLALAPTPSGWGLVYTRRSESLRSHPGEVSFPGGRVDASDAHPLAAALREAEEEIGLAPADVEVLGHLTDFLTFRDVLVCAYVGVTREAPREPRSHAEVAEVFVVPLADLLAPGAHEGRRVGLMPEGAQVHYWHVRPRTVWGITGELTARFLDRTLGWRPEAPPREVFSLEELRPSMGPASGQRPDQTP